MPAGNMAFILLQSEARDSVVHKILVSGCDDLLLPFPFESAVSSFPWCGICLLSCDVSLLPTEFPWQISLNASFGNALIPLFFPEFSLIRISMSVSWSVILTPLEFSAVSQGLEAPNDLQSLLYIFSPWEIEELTYF